MKNRSPLEMIITEVLYSWIRETNLEKMIEAQ